MKEVIPIAILNKSEISNSTTKKAMLLAEAKDAGLISDDSPSFNNVDDLMKSLDED